MYLTSELVQNRDQDATRHAQRRLEPRLTEGRYKLRVKSDTVYRLVDLGVPPGESPLDPSDIRVESMAWAKMLGKPAAEIEGTDLKGKPATLAGYRGRVVILHFWSSQQRAKPDSPPSLDEIQNSGLLEIARRFKNQRIAILALRGRVGAETVPSLAQEQVRGPLFFQSTGWPVRPRHRVSHDPRKRSHDRKIAPTGTASFSGGDYSRKWHIVERGIPTASVHR